MSLTVPILYPSKLLPNKLLIQCVINRYCVKQLTIFERTIAAASDFKNCTMVNSEISSGEMLDDFR